MENLCAMFQIKVVLNFQRFCYGWQINCLKETEYVALHLIQISIYSNGD